MGGGERKGALEETKGEEEKKGRARVVEVF
jgi:hypothetical protein